MAQGGGDRLDTTVVAGVQHPVIQMPYAIYSPATEGVVQALSELGQLVPFN